MLKQVLILLSIICYVNSFTISTLKTRSSLHLKMNNDLNSDNNENSFNSYFNPLNFDLSSNNNNIDINDAFNNANNNMKVNPAVLGSLLTLLVPVQEAHAKGKY